MTGRLFVEVINNYCAVLNHGGIPNIQTCMDQIFKSEADRSYQSNNLDKVIEQLFLDKVRKALHDFGQDIGVDIKSTLRNVNMKMQDRD